MKTLADREDLIFNPPEIDCVLSLTGLPGSGSKIYDRSRYGNIGTITGANWKRLPSGLWYLDFDGVDDWVNIPDCAALDVTRITMLAWVKHNIIASEFMLAKRVSLSDNAYALATDASNHPLSQAYISDVGKIATSSVALTVGKWHFVAGTYDGVNVRVYLDGVEVGSLPATGDIDATVDPVRVGWGYNNSLAWDGGIALPRIYNCALSGLEVRNNFDREKHLFGVW